MNVRIISILVVFAGTLFSASSRAEGSDPKAEFFAKLYASMCMKNLNNLEALRNQLIKNNLPKLPPEKAALFLNGSDGDAWPVPNQGDIGNFVLALPAGKNICIVFARRASQMDVERLFLDIASKAPAPLSGAKTIDKKADTAPNGETHTVAYSWSMPQASRKMMFTLTTAASDGALLQAMASAAIASE